MGYFSNGSEGQSYHTQWCSRCIHEDEKAGLFCPVWSLHFEFNYAECRNDNSLLHKMIPRSADKLSNEKCNFFIERHDPCQR